MCSLMNCYKAHTLVTPSRTLTVTSKTPLPMPHHNCLSPQIKYYLDFYSDQLFAHLYSFIARVASLETLFLPCPLLKSNIS